MRALANGNMNLLRGRILEEPDPSSHDLLNYLLMYIEKQMMSSASNIDHEADFAEVFITWPAAHPCILGAPPPLECHLALSVRKTLNFRDFCGSTPATEKAATAPALNVNDIPLRRSNLLDDVPMVPQHRAAASLHSGAVSNALHTNQPLQSPQDGESTRGATAALPPTSSQSTDPPAFTILYGAPGQGFINQIESASFTAAKAEDSFEAQINQLMGGNIWESDWADLLKQPVPLSYASLRASSAEKLSDQSAHQFCDPNSVWSRSISMTRTDSVRNLSQQSTGQLSDASSVLASSIVRNLSDQSTGQFSDPGSVWARSMSMTRNSGFAYGSSYAPNRRVPKEGHEVRRALGTVGRLGSAAIRIPPGLVKQARRDQKDGLAGMSEKSGDEESAEHGDGDAGEANAAVKEEGTRNQNGKRQRTS